jgi:Iap family predicted aminopeptidase
MGRVKHFVIVIAAFLISLIAASIVVVTNPVWSSGVRFMNGSVDPTLLRRHVETLAAVSPPRSHAHPSSLNVAAAYVESELRRYSDRVECQFFTVHGDTFKNVSARFGPAEGERIVIGAHYDVCLDQPGADDNASGVASLLELARLLRDTELRRPVELVAYSLEEPPHFRTEHMGSAHHAKKLYDENIPVLLMISLECIGYFSDRENSQAYPVRLLKWFYPSKADFIAVVGNLSGWAWVREIKSKMKTASKVPVCSINAPAFIPGVDFSDHMNYWKYGFDALMITDTAFFRNANYHEPTDAPATLDYDRMAEVVRGVYRAVVDI